MEKNVICYPIDTVNDLLAELDNNPAVAPKGLDQITFYAKLITVLRSGQSAVISEDPANSSQNQPAEDQNDAEVVYDAADDAESDVAEVIGAEVAGV